MSGLFMLVQVINALSAIGKFVVVVAEVIVAIQHVMAARRAVTKRRKS